MARTRKSFGPLIGLLLMLNFSVTILPLDLFHRHPSTANCVDGTARLACHHKFHVSDKASFCWVCAIHLDKTFAKPAENRYQVHAEGHQLFVSELLSGSYVRLIATSLRGPPVA